MACAQLQMDRNRDRQVGSWLCAGINVFSCFFVDASNIDRSSFRKSSSRLTDISKTDLHMQY